MKFFAKTSGPALGILLMVALVAGVAGAEAGADLEDIAGVTALKDAFNRDAGRVRLVLLLSPTCPVCVAAARWVQDDLLAANPDADVRVYAVWFNMLASDARSRYPRLLTDPRVSNYWDDTKSIGRWYGAQPEYDFPNRAPDTVIWDSYALYGPDSTWESGPSGLIGWSGGLPIVRVRQQLEREFQRSIGC